MDHNKKIDELFREKLGGYKPEFTQEHWQMMIPAIEKLRVHYRSGNAGFKIKDLIMIIVTIMVISLYMASCVFSEKTCLPKIFKSAGFLDIAISYNNCFTGRKNTFN